MEEAFALTAAAGYAVNAAIKRARYNARKGRGKQPFQNIQQGMPKHLRSGRIVSPDSPYPVYRTGPTRAPRQLFPTAMRRYGVQDFGDKPKSYCTKKYTPSVNFSTPTDKELQVYRLIEIPYNADAEKLLNNRRAKIVNVSGVKIHHVFELDTTILEPVTVRCAVLIPRNNNGLTADISTSDFWTSRNPSDIVTEPFTATDNSIVYQKNQISPKHYRVLFQKQFTLFPNKDAPNNNTTGRWDKKVFSHYVRVKRQITWSANSGAGSEFPTQNVFFVWWYCNYGDTTVTIQHPTTPAVKETHQKTIYFRTSKAFV